MQPKMVALVRLNTMNNNIPRVIDNNIPSIIGDNSFIVDLEIDTIYSTDGEVVTPANAELLKDLAWADKVHGTKTIGANLWNNKTKTPSGKILDRTSKKYLEGKFLNDLELLLNTTYQIDRSKLNPLFLDALNLESENDRELYIKYYLVGLVKKYSNLYGNNYSEYYKDLYSIFSSLDNMEVVLYFIECFSSCYQNKEMKDLLSKINTEPQKRVNKMNKSNVYFKRFWRVYA